MIVAIDGTTGSGKSTISKRLAIKTDFAYIRTGSFYRAVAYKMMQTGVNKDNIDDLCNMLKNTTIKTKLISGNLQVLLDGKNVSDIINSPEVSAYVSKISPIPEIREYVRGLQKDSAKHHKNIVMEGRDIGSVVFPNADIKIYVDCNLNTRAKRRVLQYAGTGKEISFAEAKKAIAERDWDDKHRTNSPLVKLPETVLLDTTHKSIEECVNFLMEIIKNHSKQN